MIFIVIFKKQVYIAKKRSENLAQEIQLGWHSATYDGKFNKLVDFFLQEKKLHNQYIFLKDKMIKYHLRNTNQRYPNTQRVQYTYNLFLFPSMLATFKFEQLLRRVKILLCFAYL